MDLGDSVTGRMSVSGRSVGVVELTYRGVGEELGGSALRSGVGEGVVNATTSVRAVRISAASCPDEPKKEG
ncbi:hypothetical protein GCM10009764_58220 [Nocardia ninae]|uniref:Uncharacterized protein n=1 Tax=Nocardia ninae NBRC 108245 TaxID=1210091 RepID=A0A511M4H7_9NOCA|nr:hypothetical protein NN4_00440 [Nocardia ninae NBRC 108245]